MKTLMQRAQDLEAERVFLGGPLRLFETAGQKTLKVLLSLGLAPQSKVLDIGCGCLRIGYWLIHFLDTGCYFGIEPNARMLDAGIRLLLEPELVDVKKPRFNQNSDFDFGVFKETYGFLVARSIWTHASKLQVQAMLDGFVRTANPDGILIASYVRPTPFRRDYQGPNWIGKSHESDMPGIVAHSLAWIQTQCAQRGLVAEELKGEAFNFGFQTWIAVRRNTAK